MGTMRAVAIACVPALAGCPTVNLGDTPAGIGVCNPTEGLAYFQAMIWPMYLDPPNQTTTCVRSGCHDKIDSAGGMGLDPTLPINYQGNYQIVQPQLDCESPDASQLLTKPLNLYGHGGGAVFTVSDPEYSLFLNWFK
jgi:hypothetical protein